MRTSITKLKAPHGSLQMFIDGKWTGTESGRKAFAYRLASREQIATMPEGTHKSADPNKRAISFYQSRDAFGVISPWNTPYVIPSEYPGSALAAGNPRVWVATRSTKASMKAKTDRLPNPKVAR